VRQNKTVLVIGGSGEIGSEICRELSEMGLSVGIHYVKNRKQAIKLHQSLYTPGNHKVFQSNLKSEREVRRLIKKFVAWSPNPYGMVLAGGLIPNEPWKRLKTQSWYRIFNQHCVVPFELIRSLASNLSKNSRIVYLSSISPKYGGSEKTLHYACAKSAGETAVLGLAHRLKYKGVLLNTVRAGYIETKSQRKNRNPLFRKNRIKKVYLQRAGSPKEIGFVVASLFHEQASYVANSILTVAGGD